MLTPKSRQVRQSHLLRGRFQGLLTTTVLVLTITLQLKDKYLHEVVEHAPPFTQTSKDKIVAALHKLLHLYAHCVTKGDVSAAQRQLKLHQREHIAWERDTVWRQMIGRERRGEVDGHLETVGGTLEVQQEAQALQISTPLGPLKLKRRHIWKAVAVAVFLTLLRVQTVNGDEANRCFAILVFATILWATEVTWPYSDLECPCSHQAGHPSVCYLDIHTVTLGLFACNTEYG